MIGIGSTGGRFVLGKAADRLGLHRSLLATFVGMLIMFRWWLIATSTWALVVFAVLYGICYGGFVALLPALAATYFGGRRLSSIIGVLYTSVEIGTLVGPGLAGSVYDLSGSYTLPILVGALANLGAVLCRLRLRMSPRAKKPVRSQQFTTADS